MSNAAKVGCRRRGAAIVVVLAGLAAATVMFVAATKLMLVQQKTIELRSRQVQAGWLAESGVQRAAARLAADANYRGETWQISPADLNGRDGGTVAIRVTPLPDKPDRRAVHIDADYPADPQDRARETRDITIRTQP